MNKKLIDIINNLKGSLLGIGFEESSILDAIENNENIHTCYLMTAKSIKSKKFSMTKHGRNKKINIKKIRKYFKKKSINTIICNYKTIQKFQKSFVPNSVYLNSEDLYIYGTKEELTLLKEKYQRYTNEIQFISLEEDTILKINNQNTKTNFFKDSYYKIKDTASEVTELLTDLLIN